MYIYQDKSQVVLQIKGSGVLNFLQGLISIDTLKIENKSRFFTWLDAFGFVEIEGMISQVEEEIYIAIDEKFKDKLISNINKYKLRLDIKVETTEFKTYYNFKKELSFDENNKAIKLDEEIIINDPRGTDIEIIYSKKSKEINQTKEDWDNFRYKEGLIINEDILEKQIPHLWGYELYKAFDYNKGCYLGQEKTNSIKRTKEITKHIFPAKILKGDLKKGSRIKINKQTIKVGGVNKNQAFVLLPIEDANKELKIEEVIIQSTIPKWYNLERLKK